MSWTEERVEILKRMWSEGQSASQIAKELGGVTRNAVIGKVHRLGLSNRTQTGAKPDSPSEPADAAAPPQAAVSGEPANTTAPPAKDAAAKQPAAVPVPRCGGGEMLTRTQRQRQRSKIRISDRRTGTGAHNRFWRRPPRARPFERAPGRSRSQPHGFHHGFRAPTVVAVGAVPRWQGGSATLAVGERHAGKLPLRARCTGESAA